MLKARMTSGGLSTFSMWLYQKLSVKKNKKKIVADK